MSINPSGNAMYDKKIHDAWANGTIITMPFFGADSAQFRIFGLDYGYDVAVPCQINYYI